MTGDRGVRIHYDESIYPDGDATMKRYLPAIPVILLLLLNACGSPEGSTNTLTPTSMPNTEPVPTFDNVSPMIYDYLNRVLENEIELSDKFQEVEHITGASYQVIDVSFPSNNDGTVVFHVSTRCECAANAQCCSSTRTFVMTLMAMDKSSSETIISLVPQNAQTMEVWTYDHANQGNVMRVPWPEVIRFLHDEISGFQLASEVEIR